MTTLTPYQEQYYAWWLSHCRSITDEEKYTSVLSEARVDLNPHQIEAALFAFHSPLSKGAVLADEVGLGKTIEAGIVMCQQWAEHKRHILLIVPASLRKQWNAELLDKFYLSSVIMEKKPFETILNEYRNPFDTTDDIVICSYPFARRQIDHIKRVNWDLVVFDEAHKLRNVYKGQKTAQILKDGLQPYKKLLLTATPLQNDIKELYGLISMIDDRFFGDLSGFTKKYNAAAIKNATSYKELQDRLQPIVHRTLRSQVQEYVSYTKRYAMTREYYPTEEEQELSEKILGYLQREETWGIPKRQRKLITLVLHKILASSSFAIAGTLQKIIERLEAIVENNEIDEEGSLTMKYVGDDIDEIEDVIDEWEDEEDEEDEDDTQGIIYSPEQIQSIKEEIAELRGFYNLAVSIATNNKGECLVKALSTCFRKQRKEGIEEKALVFTESKRTLLYLKSLLEENGYAGQIVLFNGSNSDPESQRIYKEWVADEANQTKITGSKTADKRQALVDYFKDKAKIMIATEAASEGINLQFCSLVVNYDLPWNPQRVEQRIGRCHRYGQKHDVVVVNFINKNNYADQRVYQLLDEKFKLFSGVFGSSDDVLGVVGESMDFESEILNILQNCRSEEEIKDAFDNLQAQMEEAINVQMDLTRKRLIENFDEDVVNRLRIRKATEEERLDTFNKCLWDLTLNVLRPYITNVDVDKNTFYLKSIPSGVNCPRGVYSLGKQGADTFTYRISHPLAQYVITTAKGQTLPIRELSFDVTNHPLQLTFLNQHIGESGWLSLRMAGFKSIKDREEVLMFSVVDDNGNVYDSDFAEKLLSVAAEEMATYKEKPSCLGDRMEDVQKATLEKLIQRNQVYIQEENEKIDKWADDKCCVIEAEIKNLKENIKAKQREALKPTSDDEYLNALRRDIATLKGKLNVKRDEIDIVEDEIYQQRDEMIQKVQESMRQKVEGTDIFTIRWTIR